MSIRILGHGLASAALALGIGWTSVASAAPTPPKVDICHWDATTKRFAVINVSSNAVSAHFKNHGDSLPASFWSDADGDGFGGADGTFDRCPQIGLVANAKDCDDGDAAVNPAADEVPYNGIDDDCESATPDNDLDNDGWAYPQDCDESSAVVNPGMAETPYNGVDDDCSAFTADDDLDRDGFFLADDCDDGNPAVNPAAQDACGDSIDNNCNLVVDENCRGACPCYGTADIDAAYKHYLQDVVGVYDYSQAYCDQYTDSSWYGGFHRALVYFYGQSWDAASYSQDYAHFYGYGFDEFYGSSYCSAYKQVYSYNYETGQYEREWSSTWLEITAEEESACEQTVLDWTVSAGLSCPVYN